MSRTVGSMSHEVGREIMKLEIEAKERARIYRAKISKLKKQQKGLYAEDPEQIVSDDLLSFGNNDSAE